MKKLILFLSVLSFTIASNAQKVNARQLEVGANRFVGGLNTSMLQVANTNLATTDFKIVSYDIAIISNKEERDFSCSGSILTNVAAAEALKNLKSKDIIIFEKINIITNKGEKKVVPAASFVIL